ncbi:MAG TPA: serine/threonine-protein kinase, partial [Chloroflexota bacterium]|nr:serine/threonine-protein kinase [Chloroflexota bacterium]
MNPTKLASAPSAQAAAEGPVVCGYKLGKMIGRGGFGKVYFGEAPGGVPVAVKIVEAPRDSNEAAQRELQSLEVIKQLRHPFLVMTHAFFSLDDRLVIAMELADGSLRDELDKNRRKGITGIPPQELIRHVIESSEALDFLHDRKMTHRDIKPENILLLSGHAKLADFGLVRVVQENRAQASASLTGTLAYMAPEVFRGHTHPNSDQYALALTYLELRFGERFVTSNDLVEAMLKHVEHDPDLSRLEPLERTVLKKALAKDPEQRWHSCTEMARALSETIGR